MLFAERKAKEKEQRVEEILCEKYDSYYRMAYSYTKKEEDAADIVQEGAYKAIRNSDSLKNIEYAETWVYRIMMNEIFRLLGNKREVSTETVEIKEQSTEDAYEDIDLQNAIETMNPQDRAIIQLLRSLIRIVTFRNYNYDDNSNTADVHVPEVLVEADDISNLMVKENIIKSSAQINEKINELSDKWIAEFEKNMIEEGFHDLKITSEIVKTTSSYFTLKLVCYEAGASGYEEHHYYTIDLNTGKELKLEDLFWEDTEYVRVISDMIKEQMKVQMEADESELMNLFEELGYAKPVGFIQK